MNAFVHGFHFLQPHWLWALLLVPVLAWWMGRRAPEMRTLSRLADPELLPWLLDGTPRSSRAPSWAVATAATLAVLALAGPTWNRQTEQLFSERAAQVVVVSMSQDMLAKDVVPDRLSRVRYKVRQLYDANRDGMNALIAYTDEPFTVAPLTTDANSVDALLSALSPDTMPVQGDDAAKAIDAAAELIHHADVHGGSIVIVTDHAGADAQAAARRAHAAGNVVSVLGIGTTRGGPIATDDGQFLKDTQGHIVMAPRDDASLRAVAAAGGGAYAVAADDRSDVTSLASYLHGHGEAKASSVSASGQWQDRGPWLLLPLLPLVALGFRRGWLLLLALAVLPLSPARAANDAAPGASRTTLADIFHTRDQQAATALGQGDAKHAQALARDAGLRGAAAFRAGDYAAAEQALRNVQTTDGQYNLGNAMAQQKHYEDAVAAYDRALKLDPKNADAAANKKAVEDFLKQQKQQDNKNDKDGKGQQKGQPQGKPGEGDKSQGQQGQQGQDRQNQDNQQGQPSNGQDKPGDQDQKNPQGSPDKPGEGEGADRNNDTGKAQPPQGDPGRKSDAERAQAEQAQQALKDKMDAALGGKAGNQDKDKGDQAHDLGAMSKEDASSKLPADVRRQLLRVPDDPGGLLRRKFMLEYQRRHGAEPEE